MADPTLSMEAAARVWHAHREIRDAEKLLADIKDKVKWGDDPTPLDGFGRRRPFQFGIPISNDGHRMLNVSHKLSVYVIESHIAAQRQELAEACIAARMELDGIVPQKEENNG